MRILYDGQIFAVQRAGGVNRYFANLIRRLPASAAPLLMLTPGAEADHATHPNLETLTCRPPGVLPSGLAFHLETAYYRAAARLGRPDVVHPTYYSSITRRPLSRYRRPVVLTVWDMIHERFPAQLDPEGRHAEEKRSAMHAAEAILCISENTKRDLLERYPALEPRVRVTYLASELDASFAHGPEPVPTRPYYLYVGGRAGYKNFDRLLEAFSRAHTHRPDLVLALVGPPFTAEESRRIAEHGLDDHVAHYGYADDPHLAKLYRCSLALVYPSLYEGFGIPPLEAMACGTAVIVSNRASLPEVVGDAGALFDPESVDDLADLLLHLHDSPSVRARLISRGAARARRFNWETTTAQTAEVYQALARS